MPIRDWEAAYRSCDSNYQRALDKIADLERQLEDQTQTASRQATLTIAALDRLREVVGKIGGYRGEFYFVDRIFEEYGPDLADGLGEATAKPTADEDQPE
jgi:hypothetical protein